MADRKREESVNNGKIENGVEFSESEDVTSTVELAADNLRVNCESSGSGSRIGLADRLSEILVEGGDGDLLLQQSDRENNFLQWLQALDLQVMGACRADERLKPLLKVNASTGAAEDRLLAHVSQYFEASEVGLLARCLCVPLVSMRVGKVVKQGTILCPTSLRGNLNLALLPSSDLRISFVGDDGHTQRLATLSDVSECSAVDVEEIPADQSGRCFLVKIPDGRIFYFWCSEKSRLLGSDLLSKMKDLLKRKPTLAELTGINESRLDCFATHLRAYLVGSGVNNTTTSGELEGLNVQSSPTSVRSLRSRHGGSQALKAQGSLSPRPSSFKEGLPKALSSLRSASREKYRHRGDLHLPTVDSSHVTNAVLELSEKGKHPEASGSSLAAPPLSFLESLGKCDFLPSSSETKSQFPPIGSLFSPYYCWCPPCTSPSMAPISQLPTSLAAPFSLPPLSSFLAASGPPNLLAQIPPLDLAGGPPLQLPGLGSNPLARLPFSKQSSQQIATFTPLMCDPIVHIPVVDVCSSGPGYLVSAGPALNLVGPMMPDGESMLEKGARETLRLLIGSSSTQPSSSLMNVLPAFLNNEDKTLGGGVVVGSRGLYSRTSDVDAIVNSFAAVGLASLSERCMRVGNLKNCATSGSGSGAPDTTTLGQSCSTSDVDVQNSTFMSREEDKD